MDAATCRGVYVTGAGGGLGRGIAERFLAAGDRVTGADLGVPEPYGGDTFLPLQVDFLSEADQRAAVERARAHAGGRLDVVVTHAFVGSATPLAELELEEWNRLIGINLRGAMLTLQSALPFLNEGASVVVTSSIAGHRYSSVMGPHYTVARYGLIGLGRHLAAELAGSGIRVNVVCPGPPNSPQMRDIVSEERLEQIAANIPTRRLAEPEDVAETVFFLAGDEARHVHGAVFDINGGLA